MKNKINYRFAEKMLIYFTGVSFLITILVLVVKFPYPTTAQVNIFRTIISLAGAGFGILLPGTIALRLTPMKGFSIRAAGAVSLFVLLYKSNPATFIAEPINKIKPSSGLAYGYYLNFLSNVIDDLNLVDSFTYAKTFGGHDTVRRKLTDYKYYICIPNSPKFAQLNNVKNISKKYIYSVYLPVARVNRNFTMYIPRVTKDTSFSIFLDIPSAITAIDEYADMLVKQNPDLKKEQVIEDELLVFKQTLTDLLDKKTLMKRKCEIKDINASATEDEIKKFFSDF